MPGRRRRRTVTSFPPGQQDLTRVAFVVNVLRQQGIEVGEAPRRFKIGRLRIRPARWSLIKRNQPYGRLAKILLEKQNFPDANLRLPMTTPAGRWGSVLGVDVKPTSDKAVFEVPRNVGVGPGVTGGGHSDSPDAMVVPHFGSNDMVKLRIALGASEGIRASAAAFKVGSDEFPAGSFVFTSGMPTSLARPKSSGWPWRTPPEHSPRTSGPFLSTFPGSRCSPPGEHAGGRLGPLRFRPVRGPLRTDLQGAAQGWRPEGGLRRDPDPSQATTGKSLVYDVDRKAGPLAYRKDPQFPTLGTYGESDDITGGMGLQGVMELQRFVEDGGVLITLGASSYMPAEFGLLPEVTATRPSAAFYAPGPIVQAEILHADHPIFFGYDKPTVPVRYANGPLFQVPEEDVAAQVLMRFTGGDDGVLSGLMRGAAETRRRPAIIDTPVGKGRIVSFATNPCYRWQNHGEFGMLFNAAVLFWNDGASKTVQGNRDKEEVTRAIK